MIRQLPSRPRNFSDLFEEYGCGSIARLPKHQNGGFELHYIEKGHLRWQIEGRTFLVPPGSVFFTFPWEKHGSVGEFEPGHLFHFAVFRLKQSGKRPARKVRLVSAFTLPERDQETIFAKLLSIRQRCFPANKNLAWTVVRLVKELSEPKALGRAHVLALSQAAFCELIENITSMQSNDQRYTPGEQRLLRLLERLRGDCTHSWTLTSMASACQLKRTQFEVLTKKLTGDTPLRLLNRIRVESAQGLLKDSDKTITEIAFHVGFDSSQYFARIFRQLIGLTPSAYRQTHNHLKCYDESFQEALRQLHTPR